MVEEGGDYSANQQAFTDVGTRLRDFEEKQRLLKDRILLIGQSVIENRESNFSEIQAMKRDLIKLKEESLRMRELLQRITEQLENVARKDELMIIQRQFDLFRK
jgi:hypothetical protein